MTRYMSYEDKLEALEKLNRIRKYIVWEMPVDDWYQSCEVIRVVAAAMTRLFSQGGAIWQEKA
jgi:hypothetical protein